MTLGEIEKLLNEKEKTKEEQIRIIRMLQLWAVPVEEKR